MSASDEPSTVEYVSHADDEESYPSARLDQALVATADHMYRQFVGGNADREKLRWLASAVATTSPDVARGIVARFGRSRGGTS